MSARTTVHTELAFRRPFAAGALQRVLAAHEIAGVERVDGDEHHRVVPGPAGPAVATVHWAGVGRDSIPVTLRLADPADEADVVARLRRWLDLDADPIVMEAHLRGDPRLHPLLDANPGLRIPGATDGFEMACMAILGQQVSLVAARTLGARLTAYLGTPAAEGLTAFPTPAAVAAADPEELRATLHVTGGRSRALQALAGAVVDGLTLTPGADLASTRAALLELPGVGPWTADYIELRALRNPDVFMTTDLVARKALGGLSPRELARLSAPWSPWRSYALMHVWTTYYYDRPTDGPASLGWLP